MAALRGGKGVLVRNLIVALVLVCGSPNTSFADLIHACVAKANGKVRVVASPGMCDNKAGECDICTPGKKTCEDDTVVTCNAQGQGYTRVNGVPCSLLRASTIRAV